jgi:hypothetical protein
VNPLPHDLYRREAFLYPVALSDDGNTNQRLRIVSNTYNTVTVRSDLDLTDYGAAESEPANVDGTADLTAATILAGQALTLTPDGMSAITLTLGGNAVGLAAIIAALTALDTTSAFEFSESTTSPGRLNIRVRDSVGSKSTLLVGAGTMNTDIGLTNTTTHTGVDGVPFRIEARMPMWGGYDGVTPAAARYLIALDLSDHIFKRYNSVNLGLVRLITPGVTDSAVKSAAAALVERYGWMYFAEFAASIEDSATPGENAIADMLANEAESDNVQHIFPSRGKILNVAKTKLVTRSVSGVALGLHSWLANVGVDSERGMHIAAANNNAQGSFSPRVQALPDTIGRWTPPVKLLNDHGIVPLMWEGSSIYAFGNRMYSRGRTQAGKRYTITERAVFYHVARDLFVTTRPFIFKSISARRLSDVQLSLREKMKVYYRDGWFSDFGGTKPGFEQQVNVQVPPSLNPPEDLLEGRVTASIEFRPRPALEDLKIIISPTQLTSEG